MIEPCKTCGGTKKVVIRGVKNGKWYAKRRRCSACKPKPPSTPKSLPW